MESMCSCWLGQSMRQLVGGVPLWVGKNLGCNRLPEIGVMVNDGNDIVLAINMSPGLPTRQLQCPRKDSRSSDVSQQRPQSFGVL
uniref:Uncharacterized protein n=1 Tax=Oryza sativa subsp. japonica TaxID=39947 RepID=Q6Z0D3_ORYSJ|nr:hypothetical protein [Oryza sativa Japonica Group]BAD03675.1 hypothetical protein [Oryza sativa Japonica Group]